MGKRFNHHGLANFSGFNPGGRGYKFRVEAAHEPQLQEDAIFFRHGDDLVAFR